MHCSNRHLVGNLIFELFFFGLHKVSIIDSNLAYQETGVSCNVFLKLEICGEHIVGSDQVDYGLSVPTFKLVVVLPDKVGDVGTT